MDSVNIEEDEFRVRRLACLQAGRKTSFQKKDRKPSERKENCSGGDRKGGRKY